MNNIFGYAKIIIENNFPERQNIRTLKSLTKEESNRERKGFGEPRKLDYSTNVYVRPRNGLGKSELSSFCNRISSAYKHQTKSARERSRIQTRDLSPKPTFTVLELFPVSVRYGPAFHTQALFDFSMAVLGTHLIGM